MLPSFYKKEVGYFVFGGASETETKRKLIKYLKPVLDVEMRARVAVHKGLPGDFDPRKLIDLVTLEVGVPETPFYIIIMYTPCIMFGRKTTEYLEMREV